MKKRSRFTTIFLILVFVAGLSLLLYPTVSERWNAVHQSRAIASYSEVVATLDDVSYEDVWKRAHAYNRELFQGNGDYFLDEMKLAEYESLLDVTNLGIMGYIEIPSIACSLPIYHGTDESILQIAIGHLEWTSLPVGGESTHCVLSGHRGLPSAKLFTNLDKVSEGDIFMLRVLDEILTYEVDQILIVEPDDTEALHITAGEDLCTLVTCTPYGVNSHRLLVRGHRIETEEAVTSAHVVSDAIQIDPMIVAGVIAIPLVLILFIGYMLKPKRRY